jgi:hypothetical protein
MARRKKHENASNGADTEEERDTASASETSDEELAADSALMDGDGEEGATNEVPGDPPDVVDGDARTSQRELPCELSAEQLIAYGAEMAECELKIGELENSRDDLNKEIKGRRGRRLELATMIDNGSEDRLVECRIEESLAENVKRVFRCDTGEKIEERALTGIELQAWLFDGPRGMGAGERSAEAAPTQPPPDPEAADFDKDFDSASDDVDAEELGAWPNQVGP